MKATSPVILAAADLGHGQGLDAVLGVLRRHRLLLDLDHHPRAPAQELEGVGQRRDPLLGVLACRSAPGSPPRPPAPRRGSSRDLARAGGGAVEGAVVEDHDVSVTRALDVELHRSAPTARADSKEASVFSGRCAESPRWAMIRGTKG